MAKATADIRSLVRAQTELAIRTLTGVCGSKGAPAAARMSAAQALLDRGWGKGRNRSPTRARTTRIPTTTHSARSCMKKRVMWAISPLTFTMAR